MDTRNEDSIFKGSRNHIIIYQGLQTVLWPHAMYEAFSSRAGEHPAIYA